MRPQEIVITSPLTNGGVKKISEFKSSSITKAYQSELGIAVAEAFNNYEKIDLYECKDSGYEFYFPFNIAGNDNFYFQLAKFDWYYNPWKWEHEQSLKFIDRSDLILEIGCGAGGFIKNLKQRFPYKNITGLEITVNTESEKFIINETIQEHVAKGNQQYDMVCSYQVLEHIADVHSFLKASIDALRSGGYLLIAVPNNDGFLLKTRGSSLLNLPPHHMGLWNKRSLEYLTKLFPLQLVEKHYEPIQDYHFEWFKSLLKQKIRKYKIPLSFRLTGNNRVMNFIASVLRRFYKGHTIMFVYQKK
jgi:SAM-dependent methyltransferase